MLELLGATALSTFFDVGPIVIVLGFFQFVVLRRPLARPGRILLGIVLVILGMTLFLVGLESALFPLGRTMALQLTEPAILGTAGASADWRDYGWIYAFAAAIGFATTIAEPALIAVALKAAQISGGAVPPFGLRLTVALGVAIGVALGCLRIVTGTPLAWCIIAGYVVVLLQTMITPRMIVPLAYDSGGVTTSTVTVPVVTALGLGLATVIPSRTPLTDGFGLIAFASLFPILTVQAYAWLASTWSRIAKARREKATVR